MPGTAIGPIFLGDELRNVEVVNIFDLPDGAAAAHGQGIVGASGNRYHLACTDSRPDSRLAPGLTKAPATSSSGGCAPSAYASRQAG